MQIETQILQQLPIDELTGAISVPIYQTSTFVQDAPGVHKGFDYARSNNPTRKALEDALARLEGGAAGFAFASGLAAIDAVLKLLQTGDEILAVDDIYGGSFRLFTHIYQKFGIKVTYTNATDAENIAKNITPATRFVWIETPTNPTLKIADIEAIAKIARANGSLLVVDNTFATPVAQKPLQLGADIVIHSATKYLGGHSDLIAGAVVTKTAELGEKIKFIQNSSGAILGPFDSWLVIRGLETLPLRVQQHCSNAQKVAEFLATHPQVKKVFYPGLYSHTNYKIAQKQQNGLFGGVISFSLENDTVEAANAFVTNTNFFKLAESLGGVKSLICHPAQMTHKSVPEEQRLAAGIAPSLIRLSVGLENAEDLITDLAQAFIAVKAVGQRAVTA
jgi:cysteine-S-conjugate beta-lyase